MKKLFFAVCLLALFGSGCTATQMMQLTAAALEGYNEGTARTRANHAAAAANSSTCQHRNFIVNYPNGTSTSCTQDSSCNIKCY